MNIVDIYVDGSYGKNNLIYCASWAYIVISNKEVIYKDKGILYGEINSMHQIGGELNAVKEAINYCIKNDFKCNIFYDYIGIKKWVLDSFDGKKPWKCKNKYTKEYREFILKNRDYIESMHWVKSHNNNFYNEMVDKLAKI